MTKHKTAIKIVRHRKEDAELYSEGTIKKGDYTSAFDDGLVTLYKKGRWTKRKKVGGPFAVFDTTKNALKFLLGNKNRFNTELQLFECKYKESTEDSLYYRSQITGRTLSEMPGFSVPQGTVFADKVKITKRIQ